MSSARQMFVAAAALATIAACGDKTQGAPPRTDPKSAPLVSDAGVASAGPYVAYDPSAGHLDDGPTNPTGTRPPARRTTRQIELVLRSTPSGAKVFVDGQERGITPVLWSGETGEHTFTFTKKDHAMSQYRFWAVTGGVVHGRLEPVAEEIKGSTPPPELVSPQLSAPPTLVSPDAPAVIAPPVPLAPPIDAPAPPPPVTIDAAPSGSPVGPTP